MTVYTIPYPGAKGETPRAAIRHFVYFTYFQEGVRIKILALTNTKYLIRCNYIVYPELITMEGAMEREEIVVLETAEDEPFGPLALCCSLLYPPFRH